MLFHAQRVSASAAGDYFQLCLGPEESDEKESDPYEVKGPYLMVQRQLRCPIVDAATLRRTTKATLATFPCD